MKTNPNDPMIPVQEQDGINHQIWHTTAGLTKREHMAIEFTKAYIAHNLLEPNHPNMTYAVKLGIETADELIKQLNA